MEKENQLWDKRTCTTLNSLRASGVRTLDSTEQHHTLAAEALMEVVLALGQGKLDRTGPAAGICGNSLTSVVHPHYRWEKSRLVLIIHAYIEGWVDLYNHV